MVWVSRFEQGGTRVLARSGWIPQLFPNAGELHPVAPESEANRETAIMADKVQASAFTGRARALGFRIALDDFGTGYNGFTNLKWIAPDELKIDMQFVRDLLDAPASENVVRAVVSLAKSFGITTVAEGVENAATMERLRELDVDFVQGYYLGRPAPLS